MQATFKHTPGSTKSSQGCVSVQWLGLHFVRSQFMCAKVCVVLLCYDEAQIKYREVVYSGVSPAEEC